MIRDGDASRRRPRASSGIEAISATMLILLLQRRIPVQSALDGATSSIRAGSSVQAEDLADLAPVVLVDLPGRSLQTARSGLSGLDRNFLRLNVINGLLQMPSVYCEAMRCQLLLQAVQLHPDIVFCLRQSGFDSLHTSMALAILRDENVVQQRLTQLTIASLLVANRLKMISEIAE